VLYPFTPSCRPRIVSTSAIKRYLSIFDIPTPTQRQQIDESIGSAFSPMRHLTSQWGPWHAGARDEERKQAMSISYRILISIGILVLHYIAEAFPLLEIFPLAEIFLMYILLLNPRWFRNFLNNMAAKQNAE
jgi:hypothetical protein